MTTTVPPTLPPDAQAAHNALHDIYTCPNCCQQELQFSKGITSEAGLFGHPDNSCALYLLAQQAYERETIEPAALFDLMVNCDPDALWDTLGPVVDRFENGAFSPSHNG